MEHLPGDVGAEAVAYIKASDEMAHELARIWATTAQKLDSLLTSANRKAAMTSRLALPPAPALPAIGEEDDADEQEDEEAEDEDENENENENEG
jgi:ribosomal protein L12E/L44/L45/RPP1/RPP2